MKSYPRAHPIDYDRAMTLALTIERLSSPLGPLLVVTDAERRVRAVDFSDYEPRLHRLFDQQCGRRAYSLSSGRIPAGVRSAIDDYFAGNLVAVGSLQVASSGTPFQETVWRALREIPPATTLTYGALAARIGRPAASRAVGAANGSNPIAIIVPCHRVIGSQGRLTGYGGGLDRKRWLLDHERAHADTAARIFEGWTLAPST